MSQFDRVCPSGNIAAQMYPNAPAERDGLFDACECEACGFADVHRCVYCKTELTEKQCDENWGKCDECHKEVYGK